MLKKIITTVSILLISMSVLSEINYDTPEIKAVWDEAKIVVLHIPGIESFFVSMFPIASGYDNTFNQIEIRKEFMLLKETLEYYGVKVYTTEEMILNNILDSNGQVVNGQQLFELQCFANHFLEIDTKQLKIPVPFNLSDYKSQIIASFAPKNLINLIFLNPTVHLIQEVDFISANNTLLPKFSVAPISNFYYLNDLGITTSKGVVVGKLTNPQRQKETLIYEYLLSDENIIPIYKIKGGGRFEGGDFLPADNVCFIGEGIRTNFEGIKQLMNNNILEAKIVVIVKDNLKYPYQMHLTKYFNFLNKNTVVLGKNRMDEENETKADIYKFYENEKKYRLDKRNVSFKDYLENNLNYKIIPVSLDDQRNLAMDYFLVKPNLIIAPEGVSREYKQVLRENGVKVIWLNIDNLKAGHGGIYSIVEVLKRKQSKKQDETESAEYNANDYANL